MTSGDPQNDSPRKNNSHVLEFLNYFASFPHSPRYAVLVKGPWGVGKTYLIKKFLEQRFPEKQGAVYVSLYGLNDSDQIDAALLQALYPFLGLKGVKIGGRLGKAALKFFKDRCRY